MSSLSEIENPMFDIVSGASIDSSVSNVIFRKYEPDVAITDTTTSININVRDLREFISLSNSYLEVRGKFGSTGNSVAMGATHRPALECGATSLFNQSRLRINQVLVEDNFSTSHLNAFVKQLTTQSKDYQDTIGRNSGFILDRGDGGNLDTANAALTAFNAGPKTNNGYLERRLELGGAVITQATTGGDSTANPAKSYTIRLADLFSFCTVNKVIRGTTLRIELNLRSKEERMYSQVSGSYFYPTNVNLYLAVVEPSLEVQAKLEGILASPVAMPYQYVNWKTYQSDTLPGTTLTRSFTFSIQSQKPLGAFVYAQRSINTGSEDLFNSMVFDSARVNFVQMRVNNKLYPYTPYEPDFSEHSDGTTVSAGASSISREYEELCKFMSKNYNVDSGIAISPREWEQLYPIYYIPLYNLPDASSYQLTLDTKLRGNVDAAITNAGRNRGNNITFYLTLMTLGEVQIKSDGQGVQIYNM